MPDPPRSINPEALRARQRMNTPYNPNLQREGAQRLLKLILGSSRDPGPRLEPPPLRGLFEAGGGRYDSFGGLPPVRNPTDPSLDLAGLSPEAQAAWTTVQDSRPRAVNNVRAVHPILKGETRDEVLGSFVPSWREMFVREQDPKTGKPFSVSEMAKTLYHELSHAVGLEDFAYPSAGMQERPISAYDVGDALERIHHDINLPKSSDPDELVRQKLIQLLKKK